MSKLPKAAMPAVKEIRKRIPRPNNLPSEPPGYHVLRWTHPISHKFCCPLGLHPENVDRPTAVSITGKPGLSEACGAFWHWWDAQTDPQAAVDAVWGKAR